MNKKWMSAILTVGFTLTSIVPTMAAEYVSPSYSGLAQSGDVLYVTDTANKTVWAYADGNMTLFAGSVSDRNKDGSVAMGLKDGNALQAKFAEPWDIVTFQGGLAVSDTEAHTIRLIKNNKVYTLAGNGDSGNKDGKTTEARFGRPTGLATDGNVLYVADTTYGTIRKVTAKGEVSTYVKELDGPTGLFWANGVLYVAETNKHRIVKVVNGVVTPVAGTYSIETQGVYNGGYKNGPVAKAKFNAPTDMLVTADNTMYVVDNGNSAVRKVKDGRVTTVADAKNNVLSLGSPRNILLSAGSLLVSDVLNGTVNAQLIYTPTFKDVESDSWYANTVKDATTRNLINGMGDGTFAPDEGVTRAQLVTMISKIELNDNGYTVLNGDTTYSDVQEDDWFSSVARWAGDRKLVRSVDGTFVGNEALNREQTVRLLYYFAISKGYLQEDPNADVMQWAVNDGIIHGFEDGTLRPEAPVTRAQAAAMMISFMDKFGL